MKPSSFGRLAIAAGLCLFFIAFAPQHSSSPQRLISRDNTHYYYFMVPSDTFDAYNTVADEIFRLQTITGCYVDTNPFGGTLLAKGYTSNVVPHTIWPSSYLYLHD